MAVEVRTDTRAGRLLAAAVPRLDWFARFRVEVSGPGAPGVCVVDRDGTVLTGRAGLRLLLSRLPVTFPLAGLVRRSRPARPGPRPEPVLVGTG